MYNGLVTSGDVSVTIDISHSVRWGAYQTHQLFIDTCLNDSFYLVITDIYLVKKVCMGFGQDSSLNEKTEFFLV